MSKRSICFAQSPKGFQRLFVRLGLIVLPAFTMLSACTVAPGMKMSTPAVVAVKDGSDTQTPTADLKIPITDIDLSTIQAARETEDKPAFLRLENASATTDLYTVGRGDVLQITVWDHPELALAQGAQPPATTQKAADPGSGFVVDQSGNLQFPFAGRLRVEGLAPQEIQSKLTAELAKTFNDPQVTVRVSSYRSKQVYIDGEVRAPGVQVLNDVPMNLYEAINRAGGFSPTADQSRLMLVRNGESFRINLPKILQEGYNPARLVLRQGDLLRVLSREDSGVFVMGEVNKPTVAVPLRDGRLTLSDALAQAGSLNTSSSDPSQVYVIRGSADKNFKVFHLDAKSPVSMLLANQFNLQTNDVVYVDGNGLVRFSRVLSLLIPAINAGLTAAIATK